MLVVGGTPQVAQDVLTGHKIKGEAIAIALVQNEPNSVGTWRLLIDVHLSQGWFRLGAILCNTPLVDGAPSRIVGFASCPGAKDWKVIASCVTPETAEIFVEGGNCCANSPFGVSLPPPGGGGGGGGGGT